MGKRSRYIDGSHKYDVDQKSHTYISTEFCDVIYMKFFSVLLRYNWNMLCKFNVYNDMTWYTYWILYILWSDGQNKVS